jgi:hypothetical protein
VLGSQVPIPAHDPNVLDVMSSEAAKVLGRAGLPRRRTAVASYRPEALTPCHTGAHAQCLQYRLQKSRVREKHDTVRDRLAEQPMTLVSAKEQRPWLSACGPRISWIYFCGLGRRPVHSLRPDAVQKRAPADSPACTLTCRCRHILCCTRCHGQHLQDQLNASLILTLEQWTSPSL